jgi:hypothetical protein
MVQCISLWQTINFTYTRAIYKEPYGHTFGVRKSRFPYITGREKNVDEHVKGFDNLICSVNLNLMFYGMISNNFPTKLSILEYNFPDLFFL